MRTGSRSGTWLRAALLVAVLCAVGTALFPEPSISICSGLSAQRLLAHVRTLSNPKFEGRGIGTDGLRQAGDYLAREFAACGLAPAGDEGTFFQRFSALGPPRLGRGNALLLQTGRKDHALEVGRDWLPLFFSASASVEGPVVFAGYGVTDGKIGVDDYKGVDAKGRVVFALRYEPAKGTSPGTRPQQLSFQSDLRFKAAAAADHGAVALVVIAGPKKDDPKLPALGEGWAVGTSGLPVVIVRREALGAVLTEAGTTLDDLVAATTGNRPRGRNLAGLTLSLTVSLRRTEVELRNVLATRPGPGTRVVIIGAHYDHLGRGGRQSLSPQKGKIHPGADDNASGTALLLEIGCELVRDKSTTINGSVLLAAFAGEENGLLGSSHYVKHPSVPLSRTLAMVNLDMVGRLRKHRLVIFGTGTAMEFPRFMARISRELNLTITSNADGYGPSDQTPFATEGLPVLHFFTGAHADYHKPSDTWEKINAAGMVTVGRAVAETVRLILAKNEPLTPGPPQARSRPVGGGGYGSYLGIIPDFSRSRGGVLLAGVREDSPAAKAHLHKGDILTELGGTKIEDLYDLTYALRTHKPGELVKIKYVRAGRRHGTETVLGQR